MRGKYWFAYFILIFAGCVQHKTFTHKEEIGNDKIISPKFSSLTRQYLEAYPLLKNSTYLILRDFEEKWQIEEFKIQPQDGSSKIFYTDSPTATGKGAIGIYLHPPGPKSVIYELIIDDWYGYNILLCPVFSNQNNLKMDVIIKDNNNKEFREIHLLKPKWNKLKIDLEKAGKSINLKNVKQIEFRFPEVPTKPIYFDDFLLANYKENLIGEFNGPKGEFFAIKQGKHIRIGVNRAFEIDFLAGTIVGWYDLTTDSFRTNNLCSEAGLGPFISHISRETSAKVHTKITQPSKNIVKLSAEFYTQDQKQPFRTITYNIHKNGNINFSIVTEIPGKYFELAFLVSAKKAFDGIIGKINYPVKLEYALFRRTGPTQGADMVAVIKPINSQPIKCKIFKTQKELSAVFPIQNPLGSRVYIEGLIKIWPRDIDNLANAEKIVRKFIQD